MRRGNPEIATRSGVGFRLVAASLAIGWTMFSAELASAQDRPSLERIEASLCAQADAEGLAYRPIFCAPRCDCLGGEDLSGVSSCAQASPGQVVEVLATAPPGDAVCGGSCSGTDEFCQVGPDCASNLCVFSHCIDEDYISSACISDVQCDQTKGYACVVTDSLGTRRCAKPISDCFGGPICDTGVVSASLYSTFEYAPAGEHVPLDCAASAAPSGFSFDAEVSSTDVGACIGSIESVLGAGACVICGDGNLDPGEQCDDGNLTPGDGCDASCQTE